MALALSACSSQASRPSGAPVAVTIGDFHIRSSSATVGGGPVVFLVRDKGPSTHEFNVVRTDLPADQLPLRSDGLTVDEESPLMHFIGGIGELDVGDSEALALRLPPGRYVLFCNLEGHYLGGMHALLEVRRDATQP
jgi:uncharacterized cupredoxin-like copper-binding protein